MLFRSALRTVGRPDVAEAFVAELERLESPRRDEASALLAGIGAQEPDVAQRSARRLAFALAEAWISGLLVEAAGRGARESAVAELWESGCEPAAGEDRFDLVVDPPHEIRTPGHPQRSEEGGAPRFRGDPGDGR